MIERRLTMDSMVLSIVSRGMKRIVAISRAWNCCSVSFEMLYFTASVLNLSLYVSVYNNESVPIISVIVCLCHSALGWKLALIHAWVEYEMTCTLSHVSYVQHIVKTIPKDEFPRNRFSDMTCSIQCLVWIKTISDKGTLHHLQLK